MPARPGPHRAHKLTAEILAWAEQALAADPALRPAALAGPIEANFGVRAHPRSIERALARHREHHSKAADLSARAPGKEEHPSLSPPPSPGPAAAEPGTCPDAGQAAAPGTGLDARYEQLRHAALHARAEAFPLGLGVLTSKGVTTWQRALADLIPAATCAAASSAARRAASASLS